MLARRGAAVEAVLLSSKVHAEGLAALRAAGGRTVAVDRGAPPDVVVDGIVGIGGRPGLKRRGGGGARRVRGCSGRRRRRPVGRRRRHRPARRAARQRRPHRHLRHPQGRPPRRPGGRGLRRRAPRRHRARPAAGAGRGAAAGRRGGDAARAGPVRAQVHPRASSVSAPVRRPIPARRCCAPRARSRGLAGMVRYAGSAADAVRARHPEIVVGDGRVQAWVVGSGGDTDAEQALADALADGVPDRGRRRRADPRRRRGPRRPRADTARRRAGADARRRARARSRPTSSPTPAAPPRSTTRWCCSRAGAPSSRTPTDGSASTTQRRALAGRRRCRGRARRHHRLAARGRARRRRTRRRRVLAARCRRGAGERRWTGHRDGVADACPRWCGACSAGRVEWENGSPMGHRWRPHPTASARRGRRRPRRGASQRAHRLRALVSGGGRQLGPAS